MAKEIKQSKNFAKKVTNLLEYLEMNWSKKVADEFKRILDEKMLRLINKPDIGRISTEVAEVRWILVTKHNKLFYRIKGEIIYMITLFDTRQNPKKNRYE